MTCAYRSSTRSCSERAQPGQDRCFWHAAAHDAGRGYPADLLERLQAKAVAREPLEGFELSSAPLRSVQLRGALAAEIRLDGADLGGGEKERGRRSFSPRRPRSG